MKRKLNFLWKGKCILIFTFLSFFCLPLMAQENLAVSGRVISAEDNLPIPGVSVSIKGQTGGTQTDIDGNYRINVERGKTLTFSFIGFAKKEVVAQTATVNVSLDPSTSELETVVVVGYNTVRKSDLTGAVASLSSAEIEKMPVRNALQAMQGKTAGVDITSNERPGERGSIRIRGVRSISATNEPLYVIDNIPMSSGSGLGVGFDVINPADIESIDVLKDASATAIYGSRGANGVIIITTKKGKEGKVALNYNGSVTTEKMHDLVEMMNSEQYIEFRRDARRRNNQYPEIPTKEADLTYFGSDPYAWANVEKGWTNGTWDGSLVPTTNWGDMVLRTGITQDHTISASGGTDKIKAYGSFGFLNQEGTQLGQDYKRYNGKFSVDLNPTKWFSMGGSVNATYGLQNYGFDSSSPSGARNQYFATRGMLPFAIPYDDNGERILLPGGDIGIINPIDEAKYNINERKYLRTLGSIYAEFKFLKDFKYRVNFGPDFHNNRNGIFRDKNSVNEGTSHFAQLSQGNRFNWTIDNLLYYDKTLDKHNFGLTLLQSASKFTTESSSMSARDLPWTSQLWHSLNSVSALSGFSTGLVETQLLSYMARANYGFNNKYLFTGSIRWDGASQLAEGNQWDIFPSAAFAWRVDQEDFIKNVNWIDQLKLRVGFGTTGNSSVNPYETKGRVETLYYTWGSTVVPGYVSSDASLASPVPMANRTLGWEKTTQYNLGFDFGFFKDRLSGSIDLYSSKTNDLLLAMTIPSLSGYVSTFDNIGETSNKGIDLQLNTRNIITKDFKWNSNISFTASKEKIDVLSNGKNDDLGNLWFIGERVSVYYDYVKDRIWQNTPADLVEIEKFKTIGNQTFKPGDIKVVDQNDDYKIDANNDRVIRGSSSPDWNAGFMNNFSYKNWDLDIFIYARWGFQIAAGQESLEGRYAQRVLDYWTPTNPTNEYPSPNSASAIGDPFRSAMNYQDGSFIKIRNISLGYNLPKQALRTLTINNLKVFAQMMNPGLIYSKIDWLDPDLGGSTFNRGFILGVNVGF